MTLRRIGARSPVRWALTVMAALMADSGTAGAQTPMPDLPGWSADDAEAALSVWRRTCDGRFAAELCRAAATTPDAVTFWQAHFTASHAVPGLVTAYYEPVLPAMRERAPDHEHPLLAMPTAPTDLTRREIEGGGLADAAALFWLSDPVDVFFLQIQGSGRLSLPDGSTARVGYGGRNAHEYRSIGRLLVEEGEMSVEEVTAERLKVWLRADPERGRALMHRNPAYIFFREVDGLLPDDGPIGSAGVPLTPLRSVALDPAAYPPGSPVWVETTTADGPLRRMMIAQDTGSAITGPGRADLFFGTGAVAGDVAGAMRAPGRLWLLTPRAAEQAG